MRTKRIDVERESMPRERKARSAEQALSALMRLAARSEKSSGDARRLMDRWMVPVEERAGVLQKLIEQRFIDDRRYSEAYAREKSKLSGWGGRKIAMQLRSKGVSRDIIAEVLATLDGDTQRTRLVEKLRRKVATIKAATEYELRGKLLRYALSLGYDYDAAIDAVDRTVAER